MSYVRDRTAADVHILGTSLGTGAGGTRYTIHLVGLGQFASRSDTLQYIREPNDVEERTRDLEDANQKLRNLDMEREMLLVEGLDRRALNDQHLVPFSGCRVSGGVVCLGVVVEW